MANREAAVWTFKSLETLLSIFRDSPPASIASLYVAFCDINLRIILVYDFMATFPRMVLVKMRSSMADSIDAVWQNFSYPVRIAV